VGRVLNLLACRPFFTTNSSYQITHCTNLNILYGIESLLEDNIIATKMKKNGWVVGVL